MVQGFYTLDEAAKVLGMPPEELNRMAQKREIRAFSDRGTWRFRTQDVEELARKRGVGSDPNQPAASPAPKSDAGPKTPAPTDSGEADFDFSLTVDDDKVDIGQDIVIDSTSSKRSASKKSSGKKSGLGPPTPRPSEDSDVRLVIDDANLDFTLSVDSDPKMPGESTSGSSKSSSARRKTGTTPQPPREDSGVRIVPMDGESDSDVRVDFDSGAKLADDEGMIEVGQDPAKTESDVRLTPDSGPRAQGAGPAALPTEEINLDEELRLEVPESPVKKTPTRVAPPERPQLPTSSPFELSEDDLAAGGDEKPGQQPKGSGSSEFDLTLPPDSDEFQLSLDDDDEDVALGEMPAKKPGTSGAPDSGINLDQPADSGISLEEGPGQSDSVEFELSLDAADSGATPRPKSASSPSDSVEFELGLDADDSKPTPKPKSGAGADSDSEFELTLDDSGAMDAVADEEEAPAEAEGEEGKDIFETDFELPGLDEESGSEAVALEEPDTDLESSDFDLALGDEDAEAEEESGSQVVALEDEEVDEGAETIARPRPQAADQEEGEEGVEGIDVDELLTDEDVAEVDEEEAEEVEAEEVEETDRVPVAATAPANWGIFPALVLLPCVLVMFFVGLMSFELVRGMWGYHQPHKPSGIVGKGLAELFGLELPKD